MNNGLTIREWKSVLRKMVQEASYVDKESSKDIWHKIRQDLEELDQSHQAKLRERVNLRLRSK